MVPKDHQIPLPITIPRYILVIMVIKSYYPTVVMVIKDHQIPFPAPFMNEHENMSGLLRKSWKTKKVQINSLFYATFYLVKFQLKFS